MAGIKTGNEKPNGLLVTARMQYPEYLDEDAPDFARRVYGMYPELKDKGVTFDDFLAKVQPEFEQDSAFRASLGKGPIETDIGGTLGTIGRGLVNLPTYLAGTLHDAEQGGDVPFEDSPEIKALEERRKAVVDGASQSKGLLGLSQRDFAEAFPNLAYSLTTMGASVAAAAPLAAIPEPTMLTKAAAWTAAGAAGWAVAQRATKSQIMREYRDAMKAEYESKGEKWDAAAWAKEKEKFDSLATEYGVWESLPEAAGNVAEIGIALLPLGRFVPKGVMGRLVSVAAKAAGFYGMEQATETVTQMGQHNVEVEAGLSPGPKRSWLSAEDWAKSAGEVFKQTFLLTTMFGGFGAVASTAHQKFMEDPRTRRLVSSVAKERGYQTLPPEQFERLLDGARDVAKRYPGDIEVQNALMAFEQEAERRKLTGDEPSGLVRKRGGVVMPGERAARGEFDAFVNQGYRAPEEEGVAPEEPAPTPTPEPGSPAPGEEPTPPPAGGGPAPSPPVGTGPSPTPGPGEDTSGAVPPPSAPSPPGPTPGPEPAPAPGGVAPTPEGPAPPEGGAGPGVEVPGAPGTGVAPGPENAPTAPLEPSGEAPAPEPQPAPSPEDGEKRHGKFTGYRGKQTDPYFLADTIAQFPQEELDSIGVSQPEVSHDPKDEKYPWKVNVTYPSLEEAGEEPLRHVSFDNEVEAARFKDYLDRLYHDEPVGRALPPGADRVVAGRLVYPDQTINGMNAERVEPIAEHYGLDPSKYNPEGKWTAAGAGRMKNDIIKAQDAWVKKHEGGKPDEEAKAAPGGPAPAPEGGTPEPGRGTEGGTDHGGGPAVPGGPAPAPGEGGGGQAGAPHGPAGPAGGAEEPAGEGGGVEEPKPPRVWEGDKPWHKEPEKEGPWNSAPFVTGPGRDFVWDTRFPPDMQVVFRDLLGRVQGAVTKLLAKVQTKLIFAGPHYYKRMNPAAAHTLRTTAIAWAEQYLNEFVYNNEHFQAEYAAARRDEKHGNAGAVEAFLAKCVQTIRHEAIHILQFQQEKRDGNKSEMERIFNLVADRGEALAEFALDNRDGEYVPELAEECRAIAMLVGQLDNAIDRTGKTPLLRREGYQAVIGGIAEAVPLAAHLKLDSEQSQALGVSLLAYVCRKAGADHSKTHLIWEVGAYWGMSSEVMFNEVWGAEFKEQSDEKAYFAGTPVAVPEGGADVRGTGGPAGGEGVGPGEEAGPEGGVVPGVGGEPPGPAPGGTEPGGGAVPPGGVPGGGHGTAPGERGAGGVGPAGGPGAQPVGGEQAGGPGPVPGGEAAPEGPGGEGQPGGPGPGEPGGGPEAGGESPAGGRVAPPAGWLSPEDFDDLVDEGAKKPKEPGEKGPAGEKRAPKEPKAPGEPTEPRAPKEPGEAPTPAEAPIVDLGPELDEMGKILAEAMARGPLAQVGEKLDEVKYGLLAKQFEAAFRKARGVFEQVVDALKYVVSMVKERFGQKAVPYLKQWYRTVLSRAARAEANKAELAKKLEKKSETDFQVNYAPQSKGAPLNTLMPRAQAEALKAALGAAESGMQEQNYADIDAYVTKKLGYKDVATMHKSLSGEQVDALGLTIFNLETSGDATIIGDQTGIGKGRVAAAMFRYAINEGHVPVFLTKDPELFSDIMRDWEDLGFPLDDIKPFIVADQTRGKVYDQDGNLLHRPPNKEARDKMFKALKTDRTPQPLKNAGFNIVFANYSQVSSGRSGQAAALKSALHSGFAVLDEAHEASGEESTRGEVMASALADVYAAVYLSATYAKRPGNMPLYHRTGMRWASFSNHEQLVRAINMGGIPLQEWLSYTLAQAGEYVRRERSFEGIKMEPVLVQDKDKTVEKATNIVARVMQDIYKLEPAIVMYREAIRNKWVADHSAEMPKGTTVSVTGPSMATVLTTMNRYTMFALKAPALADLAIQELDAGRKVYLGFENTLEAAIKQMVDNGVIKLGENMNSLSFQNILLRAIDMARKYTLKVNGKPFETGFIKPDMEGTPVQREFDRLITSVNDLEKELEHIPVSPVDYIIDRIEAHTLPQQDLEGREIPGKRPAVAKELSNREYHFSKDASGNRVLSVRGSDDKDRPGIIRTYNKRGPKGEWVDVILANGAGSTGISAHLKANDPTWRDRRPRTYISGQIQMDINHEIQKMGRINRTGQEEAAELLPGMKFVWLDMPVERRFASNFMRKMRSLNANVSGKQMGAVSATSMVDLMDKYGDMVTIDWLLKNPKVMAALNYTPMDETRWIQRQGTNLRQAETPGMDDAHSKVALRMSFMPVALQRRFYDEVEAEYVALVLDLTEEGRNDLITEDLDTKAVVRGKRLVVAGENKESPFGQDTYIEKARINWLKKPKRLAIIQKEFEQRMEGKTPEEYKAEVIEDLESRAEAYLEEAKAMTEEGTMSDAGREAEVKARLMQAKNFLRKWALGQAYHIDIGGGMQAHLVDLIADHSPGDPTLPGKIKLRFETNQMLGTWTVSKSQAEGMNTFPLRVDNANEPLRSPHQGEAVVGWWNGWDKSMPLPEAQRHNRFIVTGNLLQAYRIVQGRGHRLVTFDMKDGTKRKGILLHKDVDPDTDANWAYIGTTREQASIALKEGKKLRAALRDFNRQRHYFTVEPYIAGYSSLYSTIELFTPYWKDFKATWSKDFENDPTAKPGLLQHPDLINLLSARWEEMAGMRGHKTARIRTIDKDMHNERVQALLDILQKEYGLNFELAQKDYEELFGKAEAQVLDPKEVASITFTKHGSSGFGKRAGNFQLTLNMNEGYEHDFDPGELANIKPPDLVEWLGREVADFLITFAEMFPTGGEYTFKLASMKEWRKNWEDVLRSASTMARRGFPFNHLVVAALLGEQAAMIAQARQHHYGQDSVGFPPYADPGEWRDKDSAISGVASAIVRIYRNSSLIRYKENYGFRGRPVAYTEIPANYREQLLEALRNLEPMMPEGWRSDWIGEQYNPQTGDLEPIRMLAPWEQGWEDVARAWAVEKMAKDLGMWSGLSQTDELMGGDMSFGVESPSIFDPAAVFEMAEEGGNVESALRILAQALDLRGTPEEAPTEQPGAIHSSPRKVEAVIGNALLRPGKKTPVEKQVAKILDDADKAMVKDLGLFSQTFSLPHWLAKRFPGLARIMRIAEERVERRMFDLTHYMTRMDPMNRLTRDELGQMRDIAWMLEGEQVVSDPFFLESTREVNGKRIVVVRPNEAHYEALRKYLEKTYKAATPATIDAYVNLRRGLDESAIATLNKMREMGVGANLITQYRRTMGRIHNYIPHMRYGKFYIKAEAPNIMVQSDYGWEILTADGRHLRSYKTRARAEKFLEDNPTSTVYRQHFDVPTGMRWLAKTRAKRMLKRLLAEKTFRFQGVRWDYGVNKRLPEESVYNVGIPIAAIQQILDKAAEQLKASTSMTKHAADAIRSAMSKELADVFKQRGWGQRMMQRKDVPGFETGDIQRVAFDYFVGNTGWLSKLEASIKFAAAMKDINAQEQPELFDYVHRLVRENLRNSDRVDQMVDRVKGLAFVWFLGWNLKTSIVNLTQNIVAGIPRLSMDIGGAAFGAYAKAMKDIREIMTDPQKLKSRLSAGALAFLEAELDAVYRFYAKGVGQANLMRELRGQSLRGRKAGALRSKWGVLVNSAGYFMETAERYNRVSLFLAAYRAAIEGKVLTPSVLRRLGMNVGEKLDRGLIAKKDPVTMTKLANIEEWAADVVRDAHFVYGKHNKPQFMRGSGMQRMLGAMYVFRSFTHNLLSLWAWMIREAAAGNKRAAKGIALSVAGTFAVGGLTALPFYSTAMALYRAFFSDDDDPGEKLIATVRNMTGPRTRDIFAYGLPAALGINLGGSVGMEIPVVEGLRPGVRLTDQLAANVGEVIGVPWAMFEKAVDTVHAFQSGQTLRAIGTIMPTAVANFVNAGRLGTEGHTTMSGQPINLPGEKGPRVLSIPQAISKGLGFQPVESTKAFDLHRSIQRTEWFRQAAQKKFADRYVNAVRQGDREEARDVLEELRAWNKRVLAEGRHDLVLDITQSVRNRSKVAQPSKVLRKVAKEKRGIYMD